MGSFLGGIFTGSNPTLSGDETNAGDIMGFGTSVGEGDINAASDFDNTLLSGNQANISKLLAPQISNITGQAQQKKDTLAQFGNRSGGNNSQAQTYDDTSRANIDDMVAKLTGSAASSDAQIGESTLGTGLEANELQEQESQQKLKNQQDSLFGTSIDYGAGAAEDAGLDAVGI